nr:hypothetical protein [Halomicroarcula sp. SHR3]
MFDATISGESTVRDWPVPDHCSTIATGASSSSGETSTNWASRPTRPPSFRACRVGSRSLAGAASMASPSTAMARERCSLPLPGGSHTSPPGPSPSTPTTATATSCPAPSSVLSARVAAYAPSSTAVGRPGPAATRAASRASSTNTTVADTCRS